MARATVVGERRNIHDHRRQPRAARSPVPVASWWVSPPLYALAHVPDLLDAGPDAAAAFRAAARRAAVLSAGTRADAASRWPPDYVWLRGTRSSASRRRLWLASCALLGVPAFLSLVCLEPRSAPMSLTCLRGRAPACSNASRSALTLAALLGGSARRRVHRPGRRDAGSPARRRRRRPRAAARPADGPRELPAPRGDRRRATVAGRPSCVVPPAQRRRGRCDTAGRVERRQTRIVAGLQRAETAWSGDGRRLWLADEQGLAVIESDGHVGPEAHPQMGSRGDRSGSGRSTRARRDTRSSMRRSCAVRGATRSATAICVSMRKARHVCCSRPPGRSAARCSMRTGARVHRGLRRPALRDGHPPAHAAGARELLRCGSLEECRLVGYNAGSRKRCGYCRSAKGEDKLALRRWRQERSALGDRAPRSGWHRRCRRGALEHRARGLARHLLPRWPAPLVRQRRREHQRCSARWRQQLPGANLRSRPRPTAAVAGAAQQGDVALDRHYLYPPEKTGCSRCSRAKRVSTSAPPAGAAMHPVSYRARDGMLLHGYVLLPSGVPPATAPADRLAARRPDHASL